MVSVKLVRFATSGSQSASANAQPDVDDLTSHTGRFLGASIAQKSDVLINGHFKKWCALLVVSLELLRERNFSITDAALKDQGGRLRNVRAFSVPRGCNKSSSLHLRDYEPFPGAPWISTHCRFA